MRQIVKTCAGVEYLFASPEDWAAYHNLPDFNNCLIQENRLLLNEQVISKLVPLGHIIESVNKVNRLSLEPERRMPSSGWCFELYKDQNGFLQEEFTKKEWLKKGRQYVGVSFALGSVFERPGTKSLLSYFLPGGLLEEIAPNIYYQYDRLFAKYGGRPAVFQIEDVPDLEDFLKNYFAELYRDILETATYEFLESFDAQIYVEQIIKNHYTY